MCFDDTFSDTILSDPFLLLSSVFCKRCISIYPNFPVSTSDRKFIKDAVAIVTQAIQEDHDQNYPKAYALYKKSLEHFMIGLKCKRHYLDCAVSHRCNLSFCSPLPSCFNLFPRFNCADNLLIFPPRWRHPCSPLRDNSFHIDFMWPKHSTPNFVST